MCSVLDVFHVLSFQNVKIKIYCLLGFFVYLSVFLGGEEDWFSFGSGNFNPGPSHVTYLI
jgi:hypothetical protein